MLLAESGSPDDDLGAAYYDSPFFVRPTERVDVSQGPPRSKGRPARRSASVECGITKRPHRTTTQPHLLQGRDSSKHGTPSRSTTASSYSGLFAVLSALGTRNPIGSLANEASGSFSAGQRAPKTRQKSLMEVMQATNKALSHFTPSESDCAISPSAGSGLGSGDISPSPPISPKVFPTRPVNFGKHSLGTCHHPLEAQRSFHISRGSSRLKVIDSSMPGSSAHSVHSSNEEEDDAGCNEGEDGSGEGGEPERRANCSERERLIGELCSERVGGERHRQTDQLEGAAVGVTAVSRRSVPLTQGRRQGKGSMDRVSGQTGPSCNAPVLKQASFRNQGPPQQIAASSAVGVGDLLLGNGSVFSYPYQTSPPKTSIMDVACPSRPDNTGAAQSKPLAESDGTMGSSRMPAGSSAPQIDLQPPPSPEKVSKTHGPPTSSHSWSNNSSSAKDSGSSTNVLFSSKLARMFSGLSNSLAKKRMGEVARGVDGSRSGSEGSSVKGGQDGLRESPVSTGVAEELQREGTAKGLQGFTMVAYSPRLWLMATGETSSTSIKN